MSFPIVPSTAFDFDKADSKFSIEMSEISHQFPEVLKRNEFGIKSAKTGQIAPFRFARKFYCAEGTEDMELGGWVFDYAGNKKELMDLRVVIFND